MILPILSEEQYNIIQNIINNNNIIVDSVAGSGKTTTSLQIGTYNCDKSILLLTYNSRLKTETRLKVEELKKNNINIKMEVHSYHSFNVKYYNKTNYTDVGIVQTLKKNIPINKHIEYQILILDEAQDITETFYKFICKIFKDTCNEFTQLCILGDKNQSIFDFNNADNRYLTFANKIFNFNTKLWTITNLSTSYRITTQISNFINKHMLSYERLKAIKNGKTIKYMIIDTYKDHLSIYKQINNLVNGQYKYTYSDIFILAPSVKSETTPIKLLANYLSIIKNINIYVSSDDNEIIDEELVKNKLVITTFHQVKGLERKIVFVTNFDNSYFEYYKKSANINRLICPNELYVSCTRALEILYLVHHKSKPKLEFLNMNNLTDSCNLYYYNIANKFEHALISTKISHVESIWDIDLNCEDYLPSHIENLFANLNNLHMIKYSLLQKLIKVPNNIILLHKNIKHYLLTLIDKYDPIEILVITSSDNSPIIQELYNKLSQDIPFIDIVYPSNIINIEHIKVILYYDLTANNRKLTLMDSFYIKHDTKISSFKILFGELLQYNDCCKIINNLYNYKPKEKNSINKESIQHFTVTNLCKYLPTTIMSQIIELIEYINLEKIEKNDNIEPIWKDKQGQIYENVCTINGIAIPALFEYETRKEITIINGLKRKIMEKIILLNHKLIKTNVQPILQTHITKYISQFKQIKSLNTTFGDMLKQIITCIKMINVELTKDVKVDIKIIYLFENFIEPLNYYDLYNISNINNKEKFISCILKLSNLYNCIQTGYYHPLKQIKYYNWLDLLLVDTIITRIKKYISNNTSFEYRLIANNIIDNMPSYNNELKNYGLYGIIDCFDITHNTLWEFKCVKEFSTDHFIQVALYAYLLYKHTSTLSNNKICNNIYVNDTVYYLDNNSLKKGCILNVHNDGQSYDISSNKIILYSQIIYNKTANILINEIDTLKYNKHTKFNLFNLFTGEISTLLFNYENLKKIVGILLEHKISCNNKLDDVEFMNKVNSF
jgi:hypothetical protein